MKIEEFLKKTISRYFIITTCITFGIAAVGTILEPEARFGYDAFFAPLLYGFLSSLPAFVGYSRKELTVKQTIIRKILQWICIEVLLFLYSYINGPLLSVREATILAVDILVVYVCVNLIIWLMERKTAVEINEGLKALQQQN